ncbi:tonsoku-like protein [Zeugodacus cucurbitae]|uniref:Tonsoku-like protein n=1 Tax=Zeugodacus cucurbitae TaxID=28588 RepID=A0A0A1X4I1_ZEUCU|nr:tonsoku-like protein [Zeugodacus cucurbitae]XP_054085738.1 tonsoku-like protein [Zeugodacus cucurbitae]
MDEKKYIKRKEKARSDGNNQQLAVCCNNLGDFYNQQGKYQNAVREYQQEAEIYAKLGKKLEMAKANRMTGEMFMLLSEFDQAKEHINLYLDIVKRLHNKVEEQRAYATLGRAHLLHGQSTTESAASTAMDQLRQAERAFLKSLLLIKELSGQISKQEQLDMQARCYLNIGVVKEHMEEFEESISYIEKAIKISKSHDLFELTHLCYISMSLLYFYKKHDSTLALRYCNLALEVAKRLPNRVKKICETLITKSEILIKDGDFASAKQILTKAYKKNTPDENDRNAIEKSLRVVVKICQILDELVTTSSLDYSKRKSLYEKLGDGCCQLQNYSKAIEYYHLMLSCAEKNLEPEKNLIPIYVSLYQTYKDNKEYDQALVYLWKEYELNKDNPSEAFSTLCAIAEVCERQRQSFWTIQDIYQKAKQQVAKNTNERERAKQERVVFVRLKRLMLKHKMQMLADELLAEAKERGIQIQLYDEGNSDTESEADTATVNEENTPELGDDVCLDDLTDSDMSDLDETEKPRPHRATRGVRALTIKRNNKGETQLHQACIAGNIELVRRLLDQGHVVNVRDHAGWIPLHEACNHGFRDIVELLLDRGAAVAINDKGGISCDGITPLYDACSNGFLDVVELLLDRGADTAIKTDFGETCMNGLDKWRRSATITDGEQAHYEVIRSRLLATLSKTGICKKSAAPLTNAQVESATDAESDCGDTTLVEEELYSSGRKRISLNRSSENKKDSKESKKKSPRDKSAGMEYKTVMAQLKHPNRSNTFEVDTFEGLSCGTSSSTSLKSRRSALLTEDEIDDNDWLVDDLGPERKKRRFHTPIKEIASTSKENIHSDSKSSTWSADDALAPDDAFQVLLEAATATTKQQRKSQTRKLRLSGSSSVSSCSNLSIVRGNKTKHQSSLLENGFCRFRSESPRSGDESFDVLPTTNEPDSTTTSIHLLISPSKSSPIKVQATQVIPTTISFKIKVENELLLVPVERKKLNDINIRWLAEEAARRYYNLVGLKPVLRLKTADGFAYEENDSLNVALEQNMILATVLDWQISPLGQRYKEMCHQLKKDVNSEVLSALEQTQTSNIICLADFWLLPPITEPIFKAVLHQANLRVINLRNNFIQNEGCRQLAKSLPTLKQLKTLNLEGNLITAEGVEALLSTPSGLEELEELNLSQNPLGNDSLRILERFCSSSAAKSLQQLSLSNCKLTNLYDFDLAFFQLSAVDFSYNKLTSDSLRKLLAKLNASRLKELNLSYMQECTPADERKPALNAEYITSFFESGTCEKFRRVRLCGCHLSDLNMYKITENLQKACDLDLLDVSDNNKLSGATLLTVLSKIPHLRRLCALNCAHFVDEERLEKMQQLKQIPSFVSLTLGDRCNEYEPRLRSLWQSHWGDKAQIKTYSGCLLLHINEKDLLQNW